MGSKRLGRGLYYLTKLGQHSRDCVKFRNLGGTNEVAIGLNFMYVS